MTKKRVPIKTKLLGVLMGPIVLVTLSAILIASIKINQQGKEALQQKSEAVLNRMEAVRTFIARQGGMQKRIDELAKAYPEGDIPRRQKEQLKKRVPIIASWMIGMKNARKDNYSFRIASSNPRNPRHQARQKEERFLKKFKGDREKTITHINEETDELWVMSPVYLSEEQNCLACHGNPSQSPWGNGKDILGYNMENWDDGDLRGMFIIKSDLKPVKQEVQSAIRSISGWGLGIALIAILGGIVIIRLLVGAIMQIRRVSQQAVSGDLTQRVHIQSNDEIGDLAVYINKMTGAFNQVLQKVSGLSAYLSNATKEIEATSNNISDGAQNQASQFEELTSSVHATADSAEKADKTTRNITQDAKDAGKSVSETRDIMQRIEAHSNKIQEATEVIATISQQTNILALNANVEAARAGKHGKGFAVVAREVKKLAEHSSEAAQDIRQVIIEALELIKKGAGQSEEANQKIQDIINEIASNAGQLENIAAATKEQSQGMDNNTTITNNNASSAEQLESAAKAIADYARELDELVNRFSLGKS